MNAKDLIRWTITAMMAAALASCSAMVDPTTGDRYDDASNSGAIGADSAAMPPSTADNDALTGEVERLKRDNVALRARQSESQLRLESMEGELAKERAEHARFREMMETNFEMLEQSVSRSLADSMAKDGQPQNRAQGPLPTRTLPPPTQAPAGTEPMGHWDEPDGTPPTAVTRPAQSAAATPPASAGNSAAVPPPASAGSSATAARRPSALETLRARQPEMSESAPVAVAAVAAPMNLPPPARSQTGDDPDLTPPANPAVLSADSAAKPLYERGFVQFAKGEYDASIRTYGEFLERFPMDNHSDNAQFWIGESYFQQQKLGDAEAAYRKVLRRYDHRSTLEGYKTPDAIYRLGQIYASRDDTRRAAYYYNNVIQRFPGSTAGRKAQRELDALQSDTAGGGALMGAGGSDS